MSNLRQELRDSATAFQKTMVTHRPVVVSLGWLAYDALKAEVSASVAEMVPGYVPQSEQFDALNPLGLIHSLNCAGVECFFWNGMIIMRARSHATNRVFL